MKGHNYGHCRKCDKIHPHPKGLLGKTGPNKGKKLSVEWRNKISKTRIERGVSKGKKHPNWKGGKMLIDGYVYIWNPSHPNATKLGYVAEHRLAMEKLLGRLLEPNEIIHHINKIKTDNRVENLKLYKSTGKHASREHSQRDKRGRFIATCA